MHRSHRPLLAALLLMLASQPAYAYLDPVTGGAIIQGVIAALAAVGITARLYWQRIVQVFARKKPAAGKQRDESSGQDE